ncbi:MAG: F0F1 ATP synthase subunit gamma [Hyphomicrobiales bacterium]|nr:MAG: F0F1 ATP synthase subunit gamma [Hyphomicrobiales bacterium]
MPSLKDLRTRIASVKSTQKITKAMQMVAAAKLRRAQESAEEARPYAERIETVIARLRAALQGRAGAPRLITGSGKDNVHLLLVATAERGLCGGFNSGIAKLARDEALRLQADGKQVKILCVGIKGHDALKTMFSDQMVDLVRLSGDQAENYRIARELGTRLVEMFEAEEFDICTMFYSRFKSVISQTPVAQPLIPSTLTEADEDSAGAKSKGAQACYDYEPDESEILDDLLPRNIRVQIYRAILENGASEQGARMTAMDNATRNAGEMIDKLTLQYNRARQAMITKELIEIISGADAL